MRTFKIDPAPNHPSPKGRPLASFEPYELGNYGVSGFILCQHRYFRKIKGRRLWLLYHLATWVVHETKRFWEELIEFMSSWHAEDQPLSQRNSVDAMLGSNASPSFLHPPRSTSIFPELSLSSLSSSHFCKLLLTFPGLFFSNPQGRKIKLTVLD